MDEADQAEKLESAERERALDAQLARGREYEVPRERNGARICLDCSDPIDPKRLAARPEAVRCIWCQYLREER